MGELKEEVDTLRELGFAHNIIRAEFEFARFKFAHQNELFSRELKFAHQKDFFKSKFVKDCESMARYTRLRQRPGLDLAFRISGVMTSKIT